MSENLHSENVHDQQGKPPAQSADPAHEPAAVRAGEGRPEDPQSADDVMTRRQPGHEAADADVLAASRRYTRRSFVVAAIGTGAAYAGYRYLYNNDSADMQAPPLRDAYRVNAALSRGVFRNAELAPTYPLSRAETLRVNGIIGVQRALTPESYRLQVTGVEGDANRPGYVPDVTTWPYRYTDEHDHEDPGHDTKVDPKMESSQKMAPASKMLDALQHELVEKGRPQRGDAEAGESDSTLERGTPGLLLPIEDLAPFPRHELVTQFKCIEGWSQIVHWAGIRLADFLDAYPPAKVNGREPRYVYMETPEGDYYTGYDLAACRHPQTLLVTEMMGAPLTQLHGAPLRLHMPIKYGYKQIKRIALIAYTDDKPDDYWTKLGYDWYAGL